MLTKLDPDSRMVKTRDVRPDLRNLDDIDNELAMELLNGFIFASDDVLESLASFIRSPNHQSFVHTAVAMRKDLWGERSAIGEQVLDGIGLVPRVEGQGTMD